MIENFMPMPPHSYTRRPWKSGFTLVYEDGPFGYDASSRRSTRREFRAWRAAKVTCPPPQISLSAWQQYTGSRFHPKQIIWGFSFKVDSLVAKNVAVRPFPDFSVTISEGQIPAVVMEMCG